MANKPTTTKAKAVKVPKPPAPPPEPKPRDLSEFRVKPPPAEDLTTPRDVLEAVNNAFLACSRAVSFEKIPQSHRTYLRAFGEELVKALTSFDEGMNKSRTELFSTIKSEELMLTLSVLLKFAVLKAYPTGLPGGAYKGEV